MIQTYRNKSIKLITAKRKKASSVWWLNRHVNDVYVNQAKIDGYRSRAAYKLLEIQAKFKILKPGNTVVDLGAAPGGWSQVAASFTKSDDNSINVLAVDLLDMEKVAGVSVIKQDFLEINAANIIRQNLNTETIDVVISDMAANTTGHSATDHIRTLYLCEAAFNFALTVLNPGGHFVAKIFRGGAETTLLQIIRQHFLYVKHFKPVSSRKESKECYLIALNRRTTTLTY